VARILSIASMGLLLMFAAGEGLNFAHFKATELIQFAFFPLGICVGMILAWWKEGLGGGIAVVSLLAFYSISFAAEGSFPRGGAFFAFAAPAFLFLISWLWERSLTRRSTPRPS